MEKLLVTSALPYANGPLHIGHIAGAYLPADIYVRYKRLKGDDVVYICGTDEHGVAITIAAEKQGITPKELVDYYYKDIKNSFDKLGISFDNFSRTTKPVHYKTSQDFFLRIYEKGYIYKKDIEQFYCPKCKRFLPDRYVVGTCPYCGYPHARGDQCEKCGRWLEPTELIDPKCAICGTTPVIKKTYHYYFKLSAFAEPLRKWLESKDWKENVKNTALGWIKEGLKDRAITRDLEWGVPVPLPEAKGKVLYVWFDAPIGYISSTKEWAEKIGQPNKWKDYWLDPKTRLIHFIGKDNIVFHAIVWPAMLMAHGDFVLPDNVPANEFMNLMGDKISTSRGWAIWIPEFVDAFGPDYVRFGLAFSLPEYKDSDFNFYEFQQRVNSELADNFGNFVNRTLSFIKNYLGGRIPEAKNFKDMDLEVIKAIEEAPGKVGALLEKFEMRKALREVLDLSNLANRYFDYKKPWVTRKTDAEETARTLYLCASLVKTLSVLAEPFIPFGAQKIRQMLNIKDRLTWEDAGKLDLPAGLELGEIEILYRKISDEKIEAEVNKLKSRLKKPEPQKEEKEVEEKKISYDEFAKLDIRIGKILEAEKVEGADRLLKLKVDLGDKVITLVAGIAKFYSPEDVVGKELPVLANLEPRKIRGILSQGMILAAVDKDGNVVLLHPDKEVPPGTKVS